MNREARRVLLAWLLSSLLVAIYDVFIAWHGGTPNWLDVLLFAVWVIGVSMWLSPFAACLERRPVLRRGAAVLLGLFLLWLAPWTMHRRVSGWVWNLPWLLNEQAILIIRHYVEGTATLSTHLQAVAFATGLGLGLTILTVAWALVWRLLLRLPLVALAVQGGQRLAQRLRQGWRSLRRTRAWRPVMRATRWSLVAVMALDLVGVILTARPVTVNWEPVVTSGFPLGLPLPILTLLVGPEGALYAGTDGGGIFRSNDGGEHWQPVNYGLTDPNVYALVVGPEGELYTGTLGGVFRSDDGGAHWRPVNEGLTDLDIAALVVGPEGKLYAGTWGGGVFRSDDGGTHWRPVNEGLTDLDIAALAVGPEGELYAGAGSFYTYKAMPVGVTFTTSAIGGLFRSDDGGEHWRPVNEGLTDLEVQALLVGPEGELYAGTYGGGVFRSDDGEGHWRPVNQGLTDMDIAALVVEPKGELYAGTWGGGVFRSDDGGAHWRPANDGLTELRVRALVVGPEGELYAGTDGGVFRSSDGGEHWQSVNQGLANLSVWSLVVGPEGELYAGTGNPFTGEGGGVFRSDDGGAHWRPVNEGLTDLRVCVLAVGLEGELYAGTLYGGVFRSDDGGEHWRQTNEGLTSTYVCALLVGSERELYAGTLYGDVFRSGDGGEHWQSVNQGLANLSVWSLVMGPEGELYAGTDGGVFRSDDGGEHWRPVNEGMTDLDVLALVVGPEGELYAGTGNPFTGEGGGVFRSDDGGGHWRTVNEGLTSLQVWSLLVGPEGKLYAGTGNFIYDIVTGDVFTGGSGGVFRSDDGGEHWRPINEGLTDLHVWTLQVGPDRELYAGTQGSGIFRSDDGGEHWRPINEGLTDLDVLYLFAGPDGELYAEARSGVFRSDDDGAHWRPVNENLPAVASSGTIRMSVRRGRVYLARAGMMGNYLPWATHRYQAPQALYVHSDRAMLYAFAGAAMLLRAEVPLPLIWRAPTPYLALVAATWRAIYWAGANALPLSVGLGLALLVLGFYTASVVKSNHLRPATVLRLIVRPRYLLAASGYRDYARRWADGDALERLILLIIPPDAPFTLAEMKERLEGMNAVSSSASLRSALDGLAQRGLLVREDGSWRPALPLLAQVQRWELGRGAAPRLAEETRREHPLYVAARRFFAQAGMGLAPVSGTPFYRAAPPSALERLLPSEVYIRVLPGDVLNSREVRALREALQQVDAEATHLFVVTDRRPSDDGWAQIGTLRMEGFYFLPLDDALIYRGLTAARARAVLRDEVEERLGGRYDPYDVRDPVSGAFGFFGRDGLVQGLLRRLEAGRPVGIFGLRKMGKSSLLRVLGERAPFPVAVINLQTMEGAPQLYRRILRYWREWLRARSGPEWEPPELGEADPTGDFVEAALDLLDRLEAEGRTPRLAVLLDEVEQIVPRPDGSGPDLQAYLTLFRALRGLVDEDGRLSLIVSGLNPAINRINAWRAEQNPAFSLFQEEVLGPLSCEEAARMMRNLGRQVGLVYAEESLRAVLDLSGGHPFLARQLGSLLLRMREYNPGEVQPGEVERAAERFIYDEGTAYHLEENLWRDAGNPTLWGEESAHVNHALLLALARADGPLSQELLLDGPDADLRREALFRLERFHLIYQPEPGVYALRYGLLRRWLRRRKLGLE